MWKDGAAAPAQAPTAPTAPTAGLRWGAGAIAARLTGGEVGGALKTGGGHSSGSWYVSKCRPDVRSARLVRPLPVLAPRLAVKPASHAPAPRQAVKPASSAHAPRLTVMPASPAIALGPSSSVK
ncbi:unnamed protein product [Pleuronectes platessa]|uniref:Uncharacterized protein n=1 Tax=Pleuronectes platessa TaxID=8262 RepID=A0A9N7UDV5_PLEPL|nr:unnamed protein product [Pleuronectes platessa]